MHFRIQTESDFDMEKGSNNLEIDPVIPTMDSFTVRVLDSQLDDKRV